MVFPSFLEILLILSTPWGPTDIEIQSHGKLPGTSPRKPRNGEFAVDLLMALLMGTLGTQMGWAMVGLIISRDWWPMMWDFLRLKICRFSVSKPVGWIMGHDWCPHFSHHPTMNGIWSMPWLFFQVMSFIYPKWDRQTNPCCVQKQSPFNALADLTSWPQWNDENCRGNSPKIA